MQRAAGTRRGAGRAGDRPWARMYADHRCSGPRSAPGPGSMLVMAAMLSPYRVLDLTDGRAELATFVLAGLGADVIKIEPPGGSPSRLAGPLATGEPPARASLRFHAFN